MTNNKTLWELAVKNAAYRAYRPDWRERFTGDQLRLLRIAIIAAALVLPFVLFVLLTTV